MHKFYEFFAGGGMALAGLGPKWECLFANDIDAKKAASYAQNWGVEHLYVGDIKQLRSDRLPDQADLAWASFPCQDLSLAGNGGGLNAERSGTFWPFWSLINDLAQEQRPPTLIVLENVCGAITSHGGKDFQAIGEALTRVGYRYGALVMDASKFLPQSRPRLFIIAIRNESDTLQLFTRQEPDPIWHTSSLIKSVEALPTSLKSSWVWWSLPKPSKVTHTLSSILELEPKGVSWHTPQETKRLLELMAPTHRDKVAQMAAAGQPMVRTVYKRTRRNEQGERQQRAEVRSDEIAGCLRTPTGGSSRQTVLIVDGNNFRSRLLSPRETARLMGLPDSYILPERYNDAYHLTGDGVAVPVVRHLAKNLLEPILDHVKSASLEAA
ncbi:DNA cytosine methyltransferase [Magnetococcus sp. PR-3]|uniref:DNA cytosine methyltransferase n=1 Tax=Magnetococcus sp. PR-3 TaxID=3120355 RepID=UPI002FCE1C9B